MSVDPFEHEIVGRDPLSKTLVEAMVDAHPDFTDEQISDLIRKHSGCPVDAMTPEIVARWRGVAR